MAYLLFIACLTGPPATGDGVSASDEAPPAPTDDAPCDERDADLDGATSCDDCNDDDPLVFPGAAERCDGADSDCDGAPDPAESIDEDADGAADCLACEEAGFWSATAGLAGEALVAALHDLTSAQDCADYSTETDYLFVTLDKEPDGMVECVYTGRKIAVGSVKPDPTDMNTEHTWPQSLGAEYEPAKCDLHHLFPSDSDANNARGNTPFAEVATVETWWDDTGESAQGSASWEPREVHKGNVARAMLYFAMRYDYPTTSAELALYRAWHAADPPDATERARSLKIRDRQGEANPYVVCPELVDRL